MMGFLHFPHCLVEYLHSPHCLLGYLHSPHCLVGYLHSPHCLVGFLHSPCCLVGYLYFPHCLVGFLHFLHYLLWYIHFPHCPEVVPKYKSKCECSKKVKTLNLLVELFCIFEKLRLQPQEIYHCYYCDFVLLRPFWWPLLKLFLQLMQTFQDH